MTLAFLANLVGMGCIGLMVLRSSNVLAHRISRNSVFSAPCDELLYLVAAIAWLIAGLSIFISMEILLEPPLLFAVLALSLVVIARAFLVYGARKIPMLEPWRWFRPLDWALGIIALASFASLFVVPFFIAEPTS